MGVHSLGRLYLHPCGCGHLINVPVVATLTKPASHQPVECFCLRSPSSVADALMGVYIRHKDLHTLHSLPSVCSCFSTPDLPVTHLHARPPCHCCHWFSNFSSRCPAGNVVQHCLWVCTYCLRKTLLLWWEVHDVMDYPKLHTPGRCLLLIVKIANVHENSQENHTRHTCDAVA